jgi:hypothetical protein
MKIYILTDNEGTRKTLEESLKVTFSKENTGSDLELISYNDIPKPSIEMLIPAWEKLVITKIVESAQANIIILDKNLKNKDILYTTIGIISAIRDPRSLDGTVIFSDFESEGTYITNNLPVSGDKIITELDELVISSEEKFEDNKVFKKVPEIDDFSLLKVFETSSFKTIKVNLDDTVITDEEGKEFYNSALITLIGYAFIRGINIEMTGTKDHYILRKLGNYKKD